MGCKVCKGSDDTMEIRSMDNQPMNPLDYVPINNTQNKMQEMVSYLQGLGFQKVLFQKQTSHQVQYDKIMQKWSNNSQKVKILNIMKIISQRGIIQPLNLQNLKKANNFLRELKKQISSSEVLRFDDDLVFKCALQLNQPFPEFDLTIIGKNQKEKIYFEKNLNSNQHKIGIIRSWNLGEQMINFDRIVELVQSLEQTMPNTQISLVGVCRGTSDQQSLYESAIQSNNWYSYKHIFLDEDQPDDEGWTLDVDFDSSKGIVERQNILSTLFFYDGLLVWKLYDNELSFASDADEIEVELRRLINNPTQVQIQNAMEVDKVEQIDQKTYHNLKDTIFSISQEASTVKFTRDLMFSLNKVVDYEDGYKTKQEIRQPQISIATSPKTYEQTLQYTASLRTTSKVDVVVWDPNELILNIQNITTPRNINVQVCIELFIRIKNTEQGIQIQSRPWEESQLIAYYPSTDYIKEIKTWIQAREQIIPEIKEKMKKVQDDIAAKTMLQQIFDFFRTIPRVQQVVNTPYGPIQYCEQRFPPYEDQIIQTSNDLNDKSKQIKRQDIIRQSNKTLLVYLIDYENEDSVAILKEILARKQKMRDPKELQIVVLGHIRAESWTRLFQAFVEMKKLEKDIKDGNFETWFPLEDKICSTSFLAILGKIYSLQLEKKDIMIVDNKNTIRRVESSRRIIEIFDTLVENANGISTTDSLKENKYQIPQILFSFNKQYWNTLKQWVKAQDLKELIKQKSNNLELGSEEILYEQKVSRIWNLNEGKASYSKVYHKPRFGDQKLLPKEIQDLRKQMNIE